MYCGLFYQSCASNRVGVNNNNTFLMEGSAIFSHFLSPKIVPVN